MSGRALAATQITQGVVLIGGIVKVDTAVGIRIAAGGFWVQTQARKFDWHSFYIQQHSKID